jgi:hypothetical protein
MDRALCAQAWTRVGYLKCKLPRSGFFGGKNTMRSEPPLLTFLKPLFRLNRGLHA